MMMGSNNFWAMERIAEVELADIGEILLTDVDGF
jgi:hypothetical protein